MICVINKNNFHFFGNSQLYCLQLIMNNVNNDSEKMLKTSPNCGIAQFSLMKPHT